MKPDRAPAPSLRVRPTRVATRSANEEGRLVLVDGRLVAVLVRLQDAAHGGLVGSWYLEAGFGACADPRPPVFDTLDAARAWVRRRLAA